MSYSNHRRSTSIPRHGSAASRRHSRAGSVGSHQSSEDDHVPVMTASGFPSARAASDPNRFSMMVPSAVPGVEAPAAQPLSSAQIEAQQREFSRAADAADPMRHRYGGPDLTGFAYFNGTGENRPDWGHAASTSTQSAGQQDLRRVREQVIIDNHVRQALATADPHEYVAGRQYDDLTRMVNNDGLLTNPAGEFVDGDGVPLAPHQHPVLGQFRRGRGRRAGDAPPAYEERPNHPLLPHVNPNDFPTRQQAHPQLRNRRSLANLVRGRSRGAQDSPSDATVPQTPMQQGTTVRSRSRSRIANAARRIFRSS